MAQLVKTPARRAGDPGSNPGPGENFSLKLLIYDLPDEYSESKIFIKTEKVSPMPSHTADLRLYQ